MSAAGYDAPHLPSNFSRPEQRRSSGNYSSNYDRPLNPPARRGSPSPGVSRRPTDTYVPSRSDYPYRDGLSNSYRPNNYRPDYSSSYYSRSPSPDSYRPRLSEPEPYDRASSWRPPPPMEAPNAWSDRKFIPPSPTTSSRGRGSREDLNRSFEPSDSWKQSHSDRSSRVEHSPPSDRRFDRRPRNSSELSPDRVGLARNGRLPSFGHGGDHYPPPRPKRDTYAPARSDYDNYRPPSEDWRHWNSRFDSISPAGSHHRRDSGSLSFGRNSDRYESPYPPSRAVSGKASMSPRPVISPMSSSPSWSTPHRESDTWSYLPAAAKSGPLSRAPSRSSIASTHVSDTRSPPPPAATTVPSSSNGATESTSTFKDIPEPPKAMESKMQERRIEGTTSEGKKALNGTSHIPKATSTSLLEPTPALKSAPPVPAKPIPAVSADILVTKQSPHISNSSAKATVPTSEASASKSLIVASPASTKNEPPSAIPTPLPKAKSPTVYIPSPSPSPPPPITQESTPAVKEVIEIKQPKPTYISSPVGSPLTTPAEINIPPPTHSPVLTTPPPIHRDSAPPPVQKPLPLPEEIPPFSEAKTTRDALRIVVMTRLLCDRQSREERVNPVLAANLSLSNPPEAHPIATPDTLIEKMFSGRNLQERIDSFIKTRPLLNRYLKTRNAAIEEKIAKLREEYLTLHERWVAHCNALNEQQKNLASEHENTHTGRTTRRSTAITDAVRSDFEMEQIIASLGYDDAMDPNHLSIRNLANIPDMISVTRGHIDYLFDDTSNLVENPSEYYAPNTGIEDWTDEEKQIFLDKFAAYPKQFGIIADYLPHKTAAQCVDYYYLHKKQFIDFRRVVSQFAPNKRRRRGMGRKKGNGLLVDIAKHDMEVKGAGSSAASPAVVARAPRGRKTVVAPEVKKAASAIRRNAVQFQDDTPTTTPTPEPETTTGSGRPRRRRTANNSGTPSSAVGTSSLSAAVTPASASASAPPSASASAAPSAAPTPRVSTPPRPPPPVAQPTPTPMAEDPPEPEPDPAPRPVKRVRRTRKIKSAATVSDDHDLPSPPPAPAKELPPVNGNGTVGGAGSGSRNANGAESATKKEKSTTPSAASQWSEEEIKLFLALLSQHGDDFRRIAASMPNKTTAQVTNFYKTQGAALDLARVVAQAPKRTPSPEGRERNFSSTSTGGILQKGVLNNVSSSMTSVPPHSIPTGTSQGGQASLSSNRASTAAGPAILRPPPPSMIQTSGNPYPGMSPHSQGAPPMGRLTNANVQGVPPPADGAHRAGMYSPPHSSRSFSYTSYPPPSKPPESSSSGGNNNRASISPRISRPPTHSPSTQAARPYLNSLPRPGYSSQTSGSSVGANAPSIVHSPTGLSSPKPLPVQAHPPMQGYPSQHAQEGDLAHVAAKSSPTLQHHRPPPPPMHGYYAYPPPPHLAHHPHGPGPDPRSWAAGGTRFFNADGTSPYGSAHVRGLSNGSNDDRSGAGMRPGTNPYPVFANPLTPGPGQGHGQGTGAGGSRSTSLSSPTAVTTAARPPSSSGTGGGPSVPQKGLPPPSSPQSAAAAARYYYPGWTT